MKNNCFIDFIASAGDRFADENTLRECSKFKMFFYGPFRDMME